MHILSFNNRNPKMCSLYFPLVMEEPCSYKQNLLITNDLKLKLCDFGLSRMFSLPMGKMTHEIITLWYMAISSMGSPQLICAHLLCARDCVESWSSTEE